MANDFDLTLDREKDLEQIVAQSDSPLFQQIERLRGYPAEFINEFVIVEAKKNPSKEDVLRDLMRNGFTLNGKHYKRFGKSASQGKNGITCFVIDDIWDELFKISQLDVPVDEVVISKQEAYRCLIFSSCTLVKGYIPRIVIIDEFKKVLPHQYIRYVVEKPKEIIDKETGEWKTINSREVEEGYRDLTLNVFDGCGCHEREFSERISDAIGLDYTAIGAQVRLPYVKGYSVYVPFRKILHSWGVDTITDVYGKVHNVDDIDCIWNTSMFKGDGYFRDAYGNDAWTEYNKSLEKYEYCLGISKYSHRTKDLHVCSRLNYQYLQCLDLWNPKYIEAFNNGFKGYDSMNPDDQGEIIKIAKQTTDLFEKIILGDKLYTLKFMGISDTTGYDPVGHQVEACMINDIMFEDPAVKRQIHQKLKKSITQAKYGKIYASGFYHTVVSDMIGQLEYAAGYDVVGCLNAGEFYCKTLPEGDVLSMRSPLMCPSEVNKVKIVNNYLCEKWFGQFKDQDVVMLNMQDISAPQQGGID